MSYIFVHFWPGATEEQFRTTTRALQVEMVDGRPVGQHYTAAGPTEGGFLISGMFDTKEHYDEFLEQTSMLDRPYVEDGLKPPIQRYLAEVVFTNAPMAEPPQSR